jgi:hypothetical protein
LRHWAANASPFARDSRGATPVSFEEARVYAPFERLSREPQGPPRIAIIVTKYFFFMTFLQQRRPPHLEILLPARHVDARTTDRTPPRGAASNMRTHRFSSTGCTAAADGRGAAGDAQPKPHADARGSHLDTCGTGSALTAARHSATRHLFFIAKRPVPHGSHSRILPASSLRGMSFAYASARLPGGHG